MIRTLLTTTALVALLAGGAVAQDAAQPAADSNAATSAQPAGASTMLGKGYTMVDTDGLASKLMGFPIYTSAANDADKLGEINDLVVNQDGKIGAVIIGVGGFLGVGEKNVAVDYTDLKWVTAEDNTERLVLETTKEALNAAPGVEMVDDQPMDTAAAAPATDQPMDNDSASTDTAQNAAATTGANAANATDETQTGAINAPANAADQNGMQSFDPANQTAVDMGTLTADDLKGTNVYGPNNEHIGTIGDFVLGEDGKSIDAIIIDFGGFLGIGTKEVAIAFDKLSFYADQNGGRSLVINVTKEQMEQAVAFNRDTYANERDTQRLTVSML